MRTTFYALFALVGAACGDHTTELGADPAALRSDDGAEEVQADIAEEAETTSSEAESARADGAAAAPQEALRVYTRAFALDRCAAHDEGTLDRRACILDSARQAYSVGGGALPVVALAPPYGLLLELRDDAAPFSRKHLVAKGTVKVYAAPYHAQGWPAFPEDDEKNRIRAHVQLRGDRGLLVGIRDALPSGTQGVIVLDYTRATGGTPDCADDACTSAGYTARFYVGAEPPVVGAPPRAERQKALARTASGR